jgi:hypothetical protein
MGILAVDRKFRAEFFAEMTPHTGRRICYDRWVVSLLVEGIGHLQNTLRAIFHTEATSFASALDNVDPGRWR